MNVFEYVVLRDYVYPEFGLVLNEGDIVTDAFFPEPDIPANLRARGILGYVDEEREAARLADDGYGSAVDDTD